MQVALVLALTGSAALLAARASDVGALRADSGRILAHVKQLSSDELGGRGNGTPGLERAADYIASRFRDARLQPGGEAGTYFQPFPITIAPSADNRRALVIKGPSGDTRFALGTQYHPLFVRDADQSTGGADERLGLIFAGYGISAPGLGYDDYQDIDVAGKAVIVFTHEPQENDPSSVFDGTALTPYGGVEMKAMHARERGARLLILVEDTAHVIDRALTPAWTEDPQIDDLSLPVVRVDRARLSRALPALDFAAIARRIDLSLVPHSQAIAGATVAFDDSTAVTRARIRNVVGIQRGVDASLAREAVVIGAHYDHLGLGGEHSMAPTATGVVHNGADDNASGTAAMLEIARLLAGRRLPRTVIFAAFAGEELGLLGSQHYVRHPPVPTAQTVAMINLDMIGRARGRVMIGGDGRTNVLDHRLSALAPLTPLRLDGFAEGYEDGASDNASFFRAGVPTVAFFTGFHGDYHRPTDDWPGIDAPGVADIATLVLALTVDLARQ
jgi:hypothetical protein